MIESSFESARQDINNDRSQSSGLHPETPQRKLQNVGWLPSKTIVGVCQTNGRHEEIKYVNSGTRALTYQMKDRAREHKILKSAERKFLGREVCLRRQDVS